MDLQNAILALHISIVAGFARSQNASARATSHSISSLPGSLGAMPDYFPPTLGALSGAHGPVAHRMTNARADVLIAFYGLAPIPGNDKRAVARKVKLISNYIGVRR